MLVTITDACDPSAAASAAVHLQIQAMVELGANPFIPRIFHMSVLLFVCVGGVADVGVVGGVCVQRASVREMAVFSVCPGDLQLTLCCYLF